MYLKKKKKTGLSEMDPYILFTVCLINVSIFLPKKKKKLMSQFIYFHEKH